MFIHTYNIILLDPFDVLVNVKVNVNVHTFYNQHTKMVVFFDLFIVDNLYVHIIILRFYV